MPECDTLSDTTVTPNTPDGLQYIIWMIYNAPCVSNQNEGLNLQTGGCSSGNVFEQIPTNQCKVSIMF